MLFRSQARNAIVRLFSAAAGVFLAACATRPPALPDAECPLPPPQNCRPNDYSGKILYDTVSATDIGKLVHYEIRRLQPPVNTRDNEVGIGFINLDGAPAAAVTTDRESDTGRQSIVVFPANSIDKFGEGAALGGFTVNGGALIVDRATLVAYFSAPRVGGQVSDYDIYSGQLQRDGKSWKISSIAPLSDSVNREFSWEAQPSLSPDGNTLYFASDRPGGIGGTDIWCTRKQPNGNWGKAFNVGPGVNTECDEVTPFITTDGTKLYFASSGWSTVGGYDLFRSPIANGVPGAAENLGPPVNTRYDEIFPSSYGNADSLLYYSSTQPGGAGAFDLYVLHRIVGPVAPPVIMERPIEKPIVLAQPEVHREKIPLKKMIIDTVPVIDSVVVRGTVKDTRTHEPIPDAQVTWKQLPDHHPSGTVEADRKGDYSLTLKAQTPYEISAQAGKYFYDVYQITTPSSSDTLATIRHDFALPETLALRVNFPFNQADRPYEYTLNDSGVPSTLTCTEAINLLAEGVKTYREKILQLKLTGHTDSVGSDQYNERLGLRRAQYVKNQLVQRGVAAEIITVESRGRTQPVQRRPGEPDDVFAARCRRTELAKVLGK